MTDYLYQGLGIAVRKRAEQGTVEFGVFLDGAFIVLAAVKEGAVAKHVARAKDAAAATAAETTQ